MTLVLRRCGRGNHSPVRLTYDPARHEYWPTPIQIRRGAVLTLFGVDYRVSRVEA